MAAQEGYKGFGSFHSENVETLISIPDDQYDPPPLPFETGDLSDLGYRSEFGKSARDLFMIDFSRWTFLNHGAFGGALRPAYSRAEKWRRHCETQPLRFLDRQLFPHLVSIIRDVANFIGCDRQNVVLLPNATMGLNVVIKSIGARLGPGDVIFMLSVGYGSVKKMVQEACKESGAQVIMADIASPPRDMEELISMVEKTMPRETKLAIFDEVTSNTAMQLPIKELAKVCKERGVPVLVDGAHALGMAKLDLSDLDVDFYVTNCHKWLSAPRGSAIMCVSKPMQSLIQPVTTSHGSGHGFLSQFIWDGNRDYSPFLAIPAAIQVWTVLGLDKVDQYRSDILASAIDLLSEKWETDTPLPKDLICSTMALVRLPNGLLRGGSPSSSLAKQIQDELHFHYHIEVPIKSVWGGLYVRISVHIYNTLDDFQHLADSILDLVSRWENDGTAGVTG